jgi:PKD repeat protein
MFHHQLIFLNRSVIYVFSLALLLALAPITAHAETTFETIFSDDFTNVDDTPVSTHNGAYFNYGSQFKIINNQLQCFGESNSCGVIVSTVNQPQDGCISATATLPLEGEWIALDTGIFSHSSPRYKALIFNNRVSLQKYFSATIVKDEHSWNLTGTHVFKMCHLGGLQQFSVDGTPMAEFEDFQINTNSFGFEASNNNKIDNLVIESTIGNFPVWMLPELGSLYFEDFDDCSQIGHVLGCTEGLEQRGENYTAYTKDSYWYTYQDWQDYRIINNSWHNNCTSVDFRASFPGYSYALFLKTRLSSDWQTSDMAGFSTGNGANLHWNDGFINAEALHQDAWNNLKVCSIDDVTTAWINGQRFSRTTTVDTTALAGFTTWAARLDNLKVEEIPADKQDIYKQEILRPLVADFTVVEDNTNTKSVNISTKINDDISNTHTAVWDWGDGNTTTSTLQESTPAFYSIPVSSSHTYATSGDYTITLTVTDNQGSSSIKTYSFTVPNQPPVIDSVTSSAKRVPLNSPVTITAKFHDIEQNDTHTAQWDWGDMTTTGTLTENNGSGQVINTHTYTTPGLYSVHVFITDSQGNTTEGATPIINVVNKQLTALAPANVWVSKGLLNLGVRFDLKAEAYKDSTLVSTGQLNSVQVGSGGFNQATLVNIPFISFSPVTFSSGSALKVKVSVRNACSGSLLNSGTARLWFNDGQANSRFGATIGSTNSNYFLRNAFALATTVGAGPRQNIDVAAGAKCSTFKTFGTWTITP